MSYADSDPTVQTRPSCQAAPTSKLTDANNTAQPELSFQRKAVLAFHTRAQTISQAVATNGDGAVNTASISTSAPKRNINTISVESGEDEDSHDNQPKPCMFSPHFFACISESN